VKNNTRFEDAVLKKYGPRVCKAAAQYSVTPEAVFKDPANYFLNKDFEPMTTKERIRAVSNYGDISKDMVRAKHKTKKRW